MIATFETDHAEPVTVEPEHHAAERRSARRARPGWGLAPSRRAKAIRPCHHPAPVACGSESRPIRAELPHAVPRRAVSPTGAPVATLRGSPIEQRSRGGVASGLGAQHLNHGSMVGLLSVWHRLRVSPGTQRQFAIHFWRAPCLSSSCLLLAGLSAPGHAKSGPGFF